MVERRIRFVSFAAGAKCWHRSLVRLRAEILHSIPEAVFENVTLGDLEICANRFGVNFAEFAAENPRGFGLWLWKPMLLTIALERSYPGDVIFYLDSGCTINPDSSSRGRFSDYVSQIDQNGYLFFHLDLPEADWSKREVLEHFGLSPTERSSGQVLATVLGIRADEVSEGLIGSWLQSSLYRGSSLLKDPQMDHGQSEYFKEHRHDQSILSAIVKVNGLKSIPDETYFYPDWKKSGKNFPFWATRKCSGLSRFWGHSRVVNRILAIDRKLSHIMR